MKNFKDKLIAFLLETIAWIIAVVIIALFVVSFLTSCATRRVEVEKPIIVRQTQRDTVRLVSHYATHDTLFIRDSVITDTDGKVKERYRNTHQSSSKAGADTVFIAKHDTVPQIVRTTIREKPPEKNAWQKFLESMSHVFAYVGVMFIVVCAVKWRLGKLRQ